MALMSAEQARQLGDELRPRFSSSEAFETSWRKCFDKLKTPSAESARRWLLEDLNADGIMASALPPKEPLLPQRQDLQLGDCRHCGGKKWLRMDVPVEHRDFGKLLRCGACSDENHDKKACEICRKPRTLSGYVGPENPRLPADSPVFA